MPTIINHQGQLYRLTDGSYHLVQDAPRLRFNRQVDLIIAVTEDGRLYDTRLLQLIDIEADDFVSAGHLSALRSNGDLYESYSISIDQPLNQDNFRVIKRGVKLYSRLCTSTFTVYNKSECQVEQCNGTETIVHTYPDPIIDLVGDMAVTEYNIYLIGADRYIPRSDRLIDIGIVMYHGHGFIQYHSQVMIDSDNRTLIRWKRTDDSEDDNGDDTNILVSYLSQLSPWVRIIHISGSAHLVNRDGLVVKLSQVGHIEESQIPLHIFREPINMKNARTSIGKSE